MRLERLALYSPWLRYFRALNLSITDDGDEKLVTIKIGTTNAYRSTCVVATTIHSELF